ncbi:hypothetical protein FJT64_011815 [Amphibalanus amphitrite]|uniref:Uncharacterized protein n=1 Tax=Amphibalanus amphitrite TaxID=1232801 RepID=A0A6A4VEK3_AMPAM|nr:hypothetical protein FJT64_011815 [Amphibalanus amphitrite]
MVQPHEKYRHLPWTVCFLARQSRQWDYSQPAQYQTYGGGGYQPSRTGPAASYVIGVQPAQQYGTQQYGTQQYGTQQYGAQPVSYPAQYNPYPAAAPPPVYDPYQAVPPQPTADMALAGTQQYAMYPVPLDQYTSADSSYASYAPAPAPSYGPPSHGGGYGGGGGGYGGGGYDNSPALSALALLSFLFLLNLIQQTLNNNNNTGTGGTGGTGTATGGGRSGDGGGDWTQAWDAAQLELRVRGVLLDRVQWTQLAEETGSWLTRLRTSLSFVLPPDSSCVGGSCEDAPVDVTAGDLAVLLESLLVNSYPSEPAYLRDPQLELRNKRIRTHPAGFARAWMNRIRARERRPYPSIGLLWRGPRN